MHLYDGTSATIPVKPNKIEIFDGAVLALLLLFCFILLFWHHASLPMQVWDEGRNANNALEMARSGNWLVPQYDGLPDHENTKPPLLIWAIASLMWLGVPPLLALRTPTFLAVAATITISWGFCTFIQRDRLAGVISCVLLITSGLYGGPHVARTGDYDALLTFLILVYVLAYWLAIEGAYLQYRWLVLATVAITLAILTKGVAALLPLPGLLAFTVLRHKMLPILFSWQAWTMAIAVIGIGVGYYLSREIYDPGYIRAVNSEEVGGALFWMHNSYFSYYIRAVIDRDPFLISLLPFTVLPLFAKDRRICQFGTLLLLAAASLLFVLQLATYKHYWYLAPGYPCFVLSAALGMTIAARKLFKIFHLDAEAADFYVKTTLVVGLTISCILAYFVADPLTRHVASIRGQPTSDIGRFIAEIQKADASVPVKLIARNWATETQAKHYSPIVKFYAAFYSPDGSAINVLAPDEPLSVGTQVATCERDLLPLLKAHSDFRFLAENDGCLLALMNSSSNFD
jgi:4-amino-4-deoxy-L-arabinose transferase-like glycosyltransferase